jgi:hypothetical protein
VGRRHPTNDRDIRPGHSRRSTTKSEVHSEGELHLTRGSQADRPSRRLVVEDVSRGVHLDYVRPRDAHVDRQPAARVHDATDVPVADQQVARPPELMRAATPIRQGIAKKNALSFAIGPPTDPPN